MNTPKKVAKRELRVGGRYQHINGYFVRTIDTIEAQTVYWHDHVGPGRCTRRTFLRQVTSFAPEPDSSDPPIGGDGIRASTGGQ